MWMKLDIYLQILFANKIKEYILQKFYILKVYLHLPLNSTESIQGLNKLSIAKKYDLWLKKKFRLRLNKL